MKAVICGAGAVGRAIAERLADERNSVTVIDHSAEALATLANELDIATIEGHASHPERTSPSGSRRLRHIICRHSFG